MMFSSDFRFVFIKYTPTTEIYTLSLHDALPISSVEEILTTLRAGGHVLVLRHGATHTDQADTDPLNLEDRKSTRLNSSHSQISYAVFCLKKKNNAGSRERHSASRKPVRNMLFDR